MQTALIISPFATFPLDAGHRRRTFQVTQILKSAGYRVTFLLLAFEGEWYWGHDQEAYQGLCQQWDEVLLVYGNRQIGLPPKDGVTHHLDEWWDSTLEHVLINLFSHRFFDVAVVHNVWLSKAFDFVAPQTVKVLETHDLFWKRTDIFGRLGLKPEFFVIDEQSELFGIDRADIVVSIQALDGIELVRKTHAQVITVPFYDEGLEEQAIAKNDYLHPRKVSFGFLGSANPFNIAGVNALLASLLDVVAETFAPVEVMVGGNVSDFVAPGIEIVKLGRVKDEVSFYSQVDYAIAPVFEGTGFKIKTADALSLRLPSLLSKHSALGTIMAEHYVFATPNAMAEEMGRISIARPSISDASSAARRARNALRTSAADGRRTFLEGLAFNSEPFVIVLHNARLGSDDLLIQGFISGLRVISQHFPVILIVSDEVQALIGTLLPLSTKSMTLDQFNAARMWSHVTFLDTLGDLDRATVNARATDTFLVDHRWNRRAASETLVIGALGDLPVVHPNATWEPASIRLQRDWMKRQPTLSKEFSGSKVIVSDLAADCLPENLLFNAKLTICFVSINDWTRLQAAVLCVLYGLVAEVVWAAPARGAIHRAVLDACALKSIPIWGQLDEVAKGVGMLPRTFNQEAEKNAWRVVDSLKRKLKSEGNKASGSLAA